jgi:hypothetical protein
MVKPAMEDGRWAMGGNSGISLDVADCPLPIADRPSPAVK